AQRQGEAEAGLGAGEALALRFGGGLRILLAGIDPLQAAALVPAGLRGLALGGVLIVPLALGAVLRLFARGALEAPARAALADDQQRRDFRPAGGGIGICGREHQLSALDR